MADDYVYRRPADYLTSRPMNMAVLRAGGLAPSTITKALTYTAVGTSAFARVFVRVLSLAYTATGAATIATAFVTPLSLAYTAIGTLTFAKVFTAASVDALRRSKLLYLWIKGLF